MSIPLGQVSRLVNQDIAPPERLIGGALQPDLVEMWKAEGFPARCPVCQEQWKFVWMPMGTVGGVCWACPMYDAKCMIYVRLEDLMTDLDGGGYWCQNHEYEYPHLIERPQHVRESCKR